MHRKGTPRIGLRIHALTDRPPRLHLQTWNWSTSEQRVQSCIKWDRILCA